MADIIGTLGDDDGISNPALIGTDDDDLINGLAGDDAIEGGLGNDRIRLGAGNDTVDGGAGDDIYVVAGRAGDTITITDLSGNDTISVAGASSGTTVNLSPRETLTVDGRTIETRTRTEEEQTLDLVLVQDLSGSFADDMRTLRQLAPSIADDIATIFPDNQLGITSFIDKPQPGWPGVYEYRLELALTSDRDAFLGAVNALTNTGNYDSPESSLSALFYTAKQADQVGWRDTGGVKIAIVLTDDAYKEAGDRPIRGPNDGDDTLDGDPPGSGEGYPDVDMVRQALLDEGITPVFAVTWSFIPTYQGLVDELGFGSVVELASDSSNLDQAIREIIQTQGQTLIENAIGSDFGDTLIGNTVDNSLRGRDGDDTLSGKRGDDALIGGDGSDRAFGGDGGDLLNGGTGDDFLFGGGESDDLRGGTGADRMFGGAGADRFIIREAGDFDRIMDFEAARDRILISEAATGIGSLAELQAAATERAAGVDLAFDTGLLRIRGVELADLDNGNVLFLA